jgi:hypothetical protein
LQWWGGKDSKWWLSVSAIFIVVAEWHRAFTVFLINNIWEFSPYLTGNTLRHRYKAQPVNAV